MRDCKSWTALERCTVLNVRFGFMPILSMHPPAWPDLLDFWRAADQLEVFESGWVFDHFSAAAVRAQGPCFEAWTMMTALAQATRRLRIGTMVLSIGRRHPALLAQMALTLDTISDGRLELGLGAGWSDADHLPQGVELGPPAVRADRFDRGCATLVQLLSGCTVTVQDPHFTLIAANCGIPPVQRPHPPICIGGTGERRTLRTAARWGQSWNFPGGPVADFERKRELLHRYCVEIGRDPGEITTSVTIPVAASNPAELANRVAEFALAGVDLVIVRIGSPYRPQLLERLASALDRFVQVPAGGASDVGGEVAREVGERVTRQDLPATGA
jgi:alkanesulfonate monooxygenase SsuD/methylene tetrahydromethanopterin reductase-like flavin-dependent oxidoreductase (luciferase family)